LLTGCRYGNKYSWCRAEYCATNAQDCCEVCWVWFDKRGHLWACAVTVFTNLLQTYSSLIVEWHSLFHIKNSSKQPIISTLLTFQTSVSDGDHKGQQSKNNWLCFDEFLICNVHQPNESVYWLTLLLHNFVVCWHT